MNAELVYPSRVCVLKASLYGVEDRSLETLCSVKHQSRVPMSQKKQTHLSDSHFFPVDHQSGRLPSPA